MLLLLRRRLLSTISAPPATPLPNAPVAGTTAVKKPLELPANAQTAKLIVTEDTLTHASDLTSIAPVNGTPKQELHRTVFVQRDSANTMQSLDQHNERKMWNLRFNNEQDETHWQNQLMGWKSTGDPFSRTGLRRIKFPCADTAASFARKLGYSNVVVTDPRDCKKKPGNNTYQSNFLNNHVAAALKATPPRRMMRTLFRHPSNKQSAWVNLGNMAVKMGTSTHHTDKKSEMVSQDYWQEQSFDADKPAHRYDNWELHHEWTQKREK